MHKIILSAPFGNYLDWDFCTPTIGSFTRKFRGGKWYRLWRVLKTVRYYPGIGAWKNKLGLPNPGIESLNEKEIYRKILSIAGFSVQDWLHLIRAAIHAKPGWIELNMSCPNVPGEDKSNYSDVLSMVSSVIGEYRDRLIIKLPPVGYMQIVKEAIVRHGLNNFHCCNTLPTPGGGLSGKPLMQLSLQAITSIRGVYQIDYPGRLIGGGGVTCEDDVKTYLDRGATNVAVGSCLFFPWKWNTIKRIARNYAHSECG